MDNKKILLEILNAHRQGNRRTYNILLIIIIPLALISIGGFIYCLYTYVNPIPYYYSESYKWASYITGSIATILFIVLCICLSMRASKNRDVKVFSSENTELLVWRLDSDQWINYLEYTYGPNRSYTALSCLPWSCRREKYNRLKNRGYGYIIFSINGIIIDELEIFRFEKKILLTSVELVVFPNQQILLRFRTLHLRLLKEKRRINNEHIRQASVDIDIFVPNPFYQPIERLHQMVNLFNAPPVQARDLNPNFNQIRALFQ